MRPRRGDTWRCQREAGAYFRISVMVSFRSFPWKGREPVNISNCREQESVQALVLPPRLPHLLPPGPATQPPAQEVHLDQELYVSLPTPSIRPPGAGLGA